MSKRENVVTFLVRLAPFLADKDWDTRQATAEALGKIASAFPLRSLADADSPEDRGADHGAGPASTSDQAASAIEGGHTSKSPQRMRIETRSRDLSVKELDIRAVVASGCELTKGLMLEQKQWEEEMRLLPPEERKRKLRKRLLRELNLDNVGETLDMQGAHLTQTRALARRASSLRTIDTNPRNASSHHERNFNSPRCRRPRHFGRLLFEARGRRDRRTHAYNERSRDHRCEHSNRVSHNFVRNFPFGHPRGLPGDDLATPPPSHHSFHALQEALPQLSARERAQLKRRGSALNTPTPGAVLAATRPRSAPLGTCPPPPNPTGPSCTAIRR